MRLYDFRLYKKKSREFRRMWRVGGKEGVEAGTKKATEIHDMRKISE